MKSKLAELVEELNVFIDNISPSDMAFYLREDLKYIISRYQPTNLPDKGDK